MSSTPDFNAFADSLDPKAREYIKAYVAAQFDLVVAPLVREVKELTDTVASFAAEHDRLNAQIEAYLQRDEQAAKYVLTREKIMEFMARMGIA